MSDAAAAPAVTTTMNSTLPPVTTQGPPVAPPAPPSISVDMVAEAVKGKLLADFKSLFSGLTSTASTAANKLMYAGLGAAGAFAFDHGWVSKLLALL